MGEEPLVVESSGSVAEAPVQQDEPDTVVSEDVLVEDVSIDGMCGVY